VRREVAVSERVRIETTPVGPTASVQTPDGRWIRLHSGRDPLAEAERTLAAVTAGGDLPLLICIGLGLGYLLDAIEKHSPATRVLALEPLPEVAQAMRERRSWDDWLTSGRLTLLVGPDYAGADVSRCVRKHPSAPVVVAPVLEREFGTRVAGARAIVDQALFGARANDEARRAFAPRYVQNTLRNLPVIAASADVTALYDAFTGVPAIVVAAGPSLDRNIEQLRRVRDRALIIAVDTALRPLMDAGIQPEIVVAVDPSEVNGRHLRNLPGPSDTWLVGEASLDPAAFEQFQGRTFTFAVSEHHPWPWLRSIGLGRGGLRAWGSVITSAFDLALKAGCNPIVFAGADLAYPGERPYCRGTIYEQDWATRVAAGESLADAWRTAIEGRATLTASDVSGNPVATAAPLLAFRDWLVEQSTVSPDRSILNATEGGVLLGGRIEQCTLADAFAGAPAASPGPGAMRAAWARGRHGTKADAAAVAHQLEAVAALAPEDEPIASWLAFASPNLSAGDVTDAIDEARHPRDRGYARVPMPTSAIEGLRYAPERVRTIRDAIGGRRAKRTNPETPQAALARTSERLMRILGASGLLAADVSADDSRLPGCVPATRDFSWSENATSIVLDYETAVAEMLACRHLPGDPEITVALERLHVSYDVAAGDDLGRRRLASSDDSGDAAARLALVGEWLEVLSRWDERRDAFVPRAGGDVPLRVGAAMVRAHAEALRARLESPSSERIMDLLAGALVDAPVGVEPVPVPPLVLPALSIALSAGDDPDARPPLISIEARRGHHSVADAFGPPWLRAARTERPRGWVLPVRLTRPESPPCMVGEIFDDGHVLFTIVNGTRSIRIDAGGRCEPDAEWPMPISGEVRWGAAGAVAWHNASSRVMWRERPDGKVRSEAMPLGRGRAFPQPDGSFWWTSVRGGLWSWTPGGPWHRMVDTPPVLGLQRGTDGVRLDPRGDNLDFAVRSRVSEAFCWRPGSDAVETIPIGAEGPCWSTSSNGEWTALAYPHADAILLRNHTGVQRALTCPYPFNVAWAGASLVVSTGRADVMVFRDLLGWLQEAGRVEPS
jgi:hypothetical protein